MLYLFDPVETNQAIDRINQLNPDTQRKWGKMQVAQMLAHCCVTYEMALENIHPRPNPLARFIIKLLAKKAVVGDKPYPRNGRTAPAFIINEERDFEKEKERLIQYLRKTQGLGETHFDKKEHLSFGPLSSTEWNTLFSKHLDHHLTQFGV